MNLRQWLQGRPEAKGRTWVAQTLGVFLQVALNVQEMHGHHVAHCDIKVRGVLTLCCGHFSFGITFFAISLPNKDPCP